MLVDYKVLNLHLKDDVYPFGKYPCQKHTREIVRAIILDQDKYLFVEITRDDIFASSLTYIETSGGGVEEGENLEEAIRRELREELGIEVNILGEIAVVEDDYNLILRHNVQHYFLVEKTKEVASHQTEDELYKFHMRRLTLTYEEALAYYEKNKNEKLTHLIYQREVPVLQYAHELVGRRHDL